MATCTLQTPDVHRTRIELVAHLAAMTAAINAGDHDAAQKALNAATLSLCHVREALSCANRGMSVEEWHRTLTDAVGP